jgi:hypothetical protein
MNKKIIIITTWCLIGVMHAADHRLDIERAYDSVQTAALGKHLMGLSWRDHTVTAIKALVESKADPNTSVGGEKTLLQLL